MPEDKKEFVSGGTCEVMRSRRELRQCQTMHLGKRSLTVVLAILGIWVPKKKEGGRKNSKRGNKRKEIEP